MLTGPEPEELFSKHWMSKHSDKNSRWYRSARKMVPDIVSMFTPTDVLDLGCGACNFANLLMPHVESIVAVDGSPYSEACAAPGVTWRHYDLRKPLDLYREFDLVMCLEVAEHLDDAYSGTIVNTITEHVAEFGYVLFCAARRNQGGLGHVNEQPPDYWEELFDKAGFRRSMLDLENALRVSWKEHNVNRCYWRNLMVYTQ